MGARIENYQIVNTQMLRLMEEEDSLVVWQNDRGSQEERFQFTSKIKSIIWNAYSLDLKALSVDRSRIDLKAPVYCYSKKLNMIFKSRFTKVSPYALMVAIPDSIIDLKRLPQLKTFEEIIPSHLLLIPGKVTEKEIEHQKKLAEFREYPRKRALKNVSFNIAKKDEKILKKGKPFRLFDLSRSGASFIVQKNDFAIGDFVVIRPGYNNLKIIGKIVYLSSFRDDEEERYKIGVKFYCLNRNKVASSF